MPFHYTEKKKQDSSEEECKAHDLDVRGSIPRLAQFFYKEILFFIKKKTFLFFFCKEILYIYNR